MDELLSRSDSFDHSSSGIHSSSLGQSDSQSPLDSSETPDSQNQSGLDGDEVPVQENQNTEKETMKRDPGHKDLVHPSMIGRYQILHQLGEGGFGYVYKAHDTKLKRVVAIKIPRRERPLRKKEANRFFEEGKTLAKVHHASIVSIHDIRETDDGVPYVVMEFVEGETLSNIIKQGNLTLDRTLGLLMKIAIALKVSHKATIVHRDLKPANIIVMKNDEVKIVDFGLAMHDDLMPVDIDSAAGTPTYMAPEQIRGENHRIDGQTDIWAFGVIMYRMLTGRHPFRGKTTKALAQQIRYKEPKPIRQLNETVPKSITNICMKCMAKMMMDRYESMQDLIDDLAEAIFEISTLEHSSPGLDESQRLHESQGIYSSPASPSETLEHSNTDVHSANSTSLISHSEYSTSESLQVSYKGLRPFDSGDKDFFLSLLPGLKGKDDIPDSIRFWLKRLEGKDELEPLTVGVLYGPSGCGKSSFVRAGLIPQLPVGMTPIYLECTTENTEQRLAKQIGHKIESVDGSDSLTEILRQIRCGEHLDENEKLVIFLDQFEQLLHDADFSDDPVLVEALRHCDGDRIACVLMVRDDFWMSTDQFMKSIEVSMRDRHNIMSLPLMDERHARKVLIAYGRAFERLPRKSKDNKEGTLTRPQKLFVQEAIKSLSDDGKVICVHLSVFAQIAKDREWTSSELRNLGGLQGVGVRFLDDIFPSSERSWNSDATEEIAKTIFRELLGDMRNIKGKFKTEDELYAACDEKVSRKMFDSVLSRMESEHCLVSYVEDFGGEFESRNQDCQKQSSKCLVKLTHDFLIGPIREWLERKEKETRRGRAVRRLVELGETWNSTKDKRFLPSPFEYISLVCLTPRHYKTTYKDYLKAAGKRFWMGALVVGFLAAIAILIGLFFWNNMQNNHAKEIADKYLNAPPKGAVVRSDDVKTWSSRVTRYFERTMKSAETTPTQKLRIASAMLLLSPDDETWQDKFLTEVVNAPASEMELVARTLKASDPSLMEQLELQVQEIDDPLRRVQFAFVLLNVGRAKPATELLNRSQPGTRSEFIDKLGRFIFDFEAITGTFDQHPEPDFRSGLILALSHADDFWASEHGVKHKSKFIKKLQELYRSRNTSGSTRSAARYNLEKWNQKIEQAELIHVDSEWFQKELVDGQFAAFIRVQGANYTPTDGVPPELYAEHKSTSPYQIGWETTEQTFEDVYVCTSPVSISLFQEYVSQLPRNSGSTARLRSLLKSQVSLDDDSTPVSGITWNDAALFCNWLSEKHGLPHYYSLRLVLPISDKDLKSQLSRNALQLPLFPIIPNAIPKKRMIVLDPQGDGFRMTWFDEWTYAYKANTKSISPYSDLLETPLLHLFSWFQTGLKNEIRDSFQKMPNALGLFDMVGNVAHWTNDNFGLFFKRICGAHRNSDLVKLTPGTYGLWEPSYPMDRISFRLSLLDSQENQKIIGSMVNQ